MLNQLIEQLAELEEKIQTAMEARDPAIDYNNSSRVDRLRKGLYIILQGEGHVVNDIMERLVKIETLRKEIKTPTSFDTAESLETIWSALHQFRESLIPEGDEAYDDNWGDICTAMAWVSEALQRDTAGRSYYTVFMSIEGEDSPEIWQDWADDPLQAEIDALYSLIGKTIGAHTFTCEANKDLQNVCITHVISSKTSTELTAY